MPYINIKIKELKNLLGQFEGLTQEYRYIKSKIL